MPAGTFTVHDLPVHRLPSRIAIGVTLLGLHAVVLWLFWRVAAPVTDETEPLVSTLLFFPKPYEKTAAASTTPRLRTSQPYSGSAAEIPQDAALAPPRQPPDSTAITTPSAPGAAIDWSAQLAGAAAATIEKEKKASQQLEALTRQFEVPDDPRDPHHGAASGFRWYQARIHRFDTRGPLPVWHLNDRCVLLLFVLPTCMIGHIETHGDLFEGAAAAHDERTATPRPNDAP